MSKIFVIGLPRTGTTSISVAMLEAGFHVAHTAFTQAAFEQADVITDSPCFSDFEQLDKLFPNSIFIYLQRDISMWLPSMQRLLTKMSPQLIPKDGHFNPVLKRSFNEIFDLTNKALLSDKHLTHCYQKHKQHVEHYFKNNPLFISINLSDEDSFVTLFSFLKLPFQIGQQFPHLNKGAAVANWKAYKHPNKVNSLNAGKRQRKFFEYKSGRLNK